MSRGCILAKMIVWIYLNWLQAEPEKFGKEIFQIPFQKSVGLKIKSVKQHL